VKDLKLIMESWGAWRNKVLNEYEPRVTPPLEKREPSGPPTAEMNADGTCPEGFAPGKKAYKGKCVEEGGETAFKGEEEAPMGTSDKPSMYMPDEDLRAPQYVKILKAVAGKPEFQKIARAGKTDTKGPTDEVFVVNPGVTQAKNLKATQAEIGLGNSLDDQMSNPKWAAERGVNPAANALGLVAKGKQDPETGAVPPIEMLCTEPRCAIFTFGPFEDGTYRIIDGHHRWSQVMMMNPDAEVAIDNLELNQPILSDANDMLKLVQLAVAVKAGKVVTKPFKGENLMGVDRGVVEQAVMDGISGTTLGLMVSAKKIPGDQEIDPETKRPIFTEEDKMNAAKFIGDNLDAIKANAGYDEFTRLNVMPQPSDSGTSQSAVIDALASGEINFDAPQPSDVKVKVSEARVHRAVRNMLLGKKRRVRQAVRDMLKP